MIPTQPANNLSANGTDPAGDAIQRSSILEESLQAIAYTQATAESCAEQYPDFPELHALLQAAEAVQAVRPESLSLISKNAIQRRMMAHYGRQQKRQALQSGFWKGEGVQSIAALLSLALFSLILLGLAIIMAVAFIADQLLFANQPVLANIFSLLWTILFGYVLYRLLVYAVPVWKVLGLWKRKP